eukprot:GHUV01008807.1.p1 GENE.GHUV01008807.1~~GHUV01008807.1.p1  ORF type:complete len:191 (+),score=26.79 GHUV01008807.1:75-647(+)
MLQTRQNSHYSACSTRSSSIAPLVNCTTALRRHVCRATGNSASDAAGRPAAASKHLQHTTVAGAVLGLTALSVLSPQAANALTIHTEPANALSLPTWAIHVSSVTEWVAAMALMWRYAEVSGNPRWKGMTWGMMPSLGSAMAACTWHFFYNSPDLDFLVAVQAFLTVVGNCTCWYAAYRIYEAAQAQKAS